MNIEDYTCVELVGYTQPAKNFEGEFTDVKDLIAYCARVSNPSNQFNTETADKLIAYLLKHKHFSPFEMASVTIEVETTRDIARQLLRHRSFTFQEFCITGDSKITTLTKGGNTKRVTIADLYSRYQNKQYWDMAGNLVRVYDEATGVLKRAKIKEVFSTGVKPVYALTIENGKMIKSTQDHKFLTKDGFKRLADISVNDFIGCNGYKGKVSWHKVQSVEYVGEEQTYDMEIDHESHNYVANGIVTHNSQRYADPVKDLSFVIRETRMQDQKNRQSSLEINREDEEERFIDSEWKRRQHEIIDLVKEHYEWAVGCGIAKEQARSILPEGNTKSRLYVQGTIRSFIHYIEVRKDISTQKEHRVLALATAKAIAEIFPLQ